MIVVLAVLSVAMAASYAMLRSEANTLLIQQNGRRIISARQAANTGLNIAIRRMHEPGWVGVGSVLAATIAPGERFEATYTTGDSALVEGSSEFDSFPFRVTVSATGFASDRTGTAPEASHRCEAVVQLVPRALAAEPANWNKMVDEFSFYQWGRNHERFRVEFPFRIEGAVHIQGELRLCDVNPKDDDITEELLDDLNEMRLDSGVDKRPFDGPVSLCDDNTDSDYINYLRNELGLVVHTDVPLLDSKPPGMPASFGSYRLYPGGETYSIESVASPLGNISLGPNPRTNPAGLFVAAAGMTINPGVEVLGTLIVSGDASVLIGSDVRLEAFNLPPLYGTSEPVQLPAFVGGNDLRIRAGAGGTMRGLVQVADLFSIDKGSQLMTLDVEGRVVTREFEIQPRTSWELSIAGWRLEWTLFSLQRGLLGAIKYFPDWLNSRLISCEPLLTFKPESSPVRYHSILGGGTIEIYAPAAGDEGLVWETISWSEDPDNP